MLLLVSGSALALDLNWDTVTDLSACGKTAANPQIALSSNGTRATAIWYCLDGSSRIIQSRSATINGNTATWGGVTTDLSALLGAGKRASSSPQIAISSDGARATAVWIHGTSNSTIQSRTATISANTATWSPVTTDISASGQSAHPAKIALSSDGTRATVVWNSSIPGSDVIFSRIQSRSATINGNTATWGAVTTDISASGQNASYPQIALSSDGTCATAVWQRWDGSNYIVQSRSTTINGNTATWEAVTTDLSASGQNAWIPEISRSSDGTMGTAVWYRFDGSRNIIQSRSATISGNTTTWGAVTTDLSVSGQNAQGAKIALSSDGTRAAAVWFRGGVVDGLKQIIQSRSAVISGNIATWSTVATDLSASGQDANLPQMALSSDGTRATAVWFRFDGSKNIIQSSSAKGDGETSLFVVPLPAGKVVTFDL